MFALGMLAVFQVTLLPGLLLIRFFPSKRGFIQNLTYVFSLSMLANYVGVLILTALKLYIQPVVFGIFALELVCLFWVYRKHFSKSLSDLLLASFSSVANAYASLIRAFRDFFIRGRRVLTTRPSKIRNEEFSRLLSDMLRFIFALVAIGCILYVGYIFFNQLGTVYQVPDAWASWDPWAVDWFHNKYARNTWEYPQLIPINWSLTYQFIGDATVKFFAKGLMPIFTLLLLLLIFDLGRKSKSFGYFLGAGIAFFAINRFIGKYIADGYVDLPVTLFTFLAFYTLLRAREAKGKREMRETLIIGALVSAVAAVTKQTGAYILVFYPILAYVIVVRDYRGMSVREKFGILVWPFILALLIVLPWYVYTEVMISRGEYTSNIQYVINDIYEGLTLPERFVAALHSLGKYVYIYVFLILSLPFMDRAYRWLIVTIILPYSILWAFFLSYEHRNLAIAFPLVGIAAGIGAEKIFERIRFARVKVYAIPVLLAASLLLGSAVYSAERLTQQQIGLQKDIFRTQLNRRLYTYFDNQGGPQKVITDYNPINWLPGLEGIGIKELFRDYPSYQATLLGRPDVVLLLVPESTRDPRIIEEIMEKIGSGIYDLIFTQAGYLLVHIPPR